MRSSVARAPLVEALGQQLPSLSIIDAVDGRTMSQTQQDAVCAPNLLRPRYPFGMMPSEIGCFLSHRKAWQALVDSQAKYAFVAEDDVVLGPDFAAAQALAQAQVAPNQLIRFPMQPRETADHMVTTQGDLSMFRPKVIGLTAALYLVGREAAQTLLTRSEQFDRPVDTWLQMRWVTGVDSLTLWPAGITSAAHDHGGSTIQAKKSVWAEVRRTWHRARYRSAIAKMSAKS